MAKNKDADNEGGTGKALTVFIVLLIVITWLSVMALLIKCDVGGFGSSVLRPVFKNVPILNVILPNASDAEIAKENDYPYDTFEAALDQVAVLDQANKDKDGQIAELSDKVSELESEVARLSVFEKEQKNFTEEKNKFYNEIVYGESAPDADTYIEWYNQLDPEYAENVYREIINSKQVDQEILDLASAYESMDRKKAAQILESMSNDLDTVALILNNVSTSARGEILAEMNADYAASVTKKLLP